jgi:dTDP-4-dehydrorhamnose reductase
VKVAVVGAEGQLGTDFVRIFTERGHDVAPLSHKQIDVTEPIVVSEVISELQPEAVLNCAAFHRVDDCEDRPGDTFAVNAVGALNVARASEEVGAVGIYISSDYVFDGFKQQAYVEADRVHPLNVYGASKMAGELLVEQTCARWMVIRVASLFGVAGASGKGGNFVETILARAKSGSPLTVVDDIRMSPTYTLDVAEGVESLLTQQAWGLHHLTNAGSVSWYGFARKILELTGVEANLEATLSSDRPTRARRPANSALSTSNPGSDSLREWEDALKSYLSEKDHI